jgi:hypothetical protein
MNSVDPPLKNLNVTLFAYHLCQDLSLTNDGLREDADDLWKWCENLPEATNFNIPELKKLRHKIKANQNSLITDDRYLELLGKDGWEPQYPNNYPLNVYIYPVRIHDTYCLDFTLHHPESDLSSDDFQQLNPNNILQPDSIPASLGKTLLLYAEPMSGKPDIDPQFAHTCVDRFLGTSQAESWFVKQGLLLGGKIFEYENFAPDPRKHIHILFWINPDPDRVGNLKKSIINLLGCRTKVLFASHQAQTNYKVAREINSYLEQQTQEFSTLVRSPKRLEGFKQILEQVPPQSLTYAYCLRSISEQITTIEANAKDYVRWLNRLKSLSLPGDDLSFFADFHDRIDRTFLPQIQVYLSYLTPGQELYNKMLESIRGLVEIEEAERDRSLEKTIQVVGIALGIGGLVASSSPSTLQEKAITFFPDRQPFPPLLPHLHPFLFSALVTLLATVFCGFTAYLYVFKIRK